jgi:hypothetical protein
MKNDLKPNGSPPRRRPARRIFVDCTDTYRHPELSVRVKFTYTKTLSAW